MPRDNRIPLPDPVKVKELYRLIADMMAEGRKPVCNDIDQTYALCIVDSIKLPGVSMILRYTEHFITLAVTYKAEDYRQILDECQTLPAPVQAVLDKLGTSVNLVEDIDSPFLKAVMDAV